MMQTAMTALLTKIVARARNISFPWRRLLSWRPSLPRGPSVASRPSFSWQGMFSWKRNLSWSKLAALAHDLVRTRLDKSGGRIRLLMVGLCLAYLGIGAQLVQARPVA